MSVVSLTRYTRDVERNRQVTIIIIIIIITTPNETQAGALHDPSVGEGVM
jgi:hypothetical protein